MSEQNAGHDASGPGALPPRGARNLVIGRIGLSVAAGLWLCVAAVGVIWLTAYNRVPGRSGPAPSCWPSGAPFERTADRSTALLFLHPRCPCSRATVREVARALRDGTDRIALRVVVFVPRGQGEAWWKTGCVEDALAFPGAVLTVDVDGGEARRFGAHTSGELLVFGADGTLQFQGGVTSLRGHEGDNAGVDALRSLAKGERPRTVRTAVFGCSIDEDGSLCGEASPCR